MLTDLTDIGEGQHLL